MSRRRSRSDGVTLIELIVVIVVTAILAGMMATFALPMVQALESSRRAELTDIADTAARRIARASGTVTTGQHPTAAD